MSAGEEGGEDSRPAPEGWAAKIKEQWRRTKEHAETYPYLWASYIVVYGGLGVYATYKWRKLRRTEDRVRALQERWKKLVEAEEAGSSSASAAEKTVDGSGKK